MDVKRDVTKISGLFPNTHRMFLDFIFSEKSEKIAGTVPAILIFTNSIRICVDVGAIDFQYIVLFLDTISILGTLFYFGTLSLSLSLSLSL